MAITHDGDVLRITARMNLLSTGAVENVYTMRWNGLLSSEDGPVMTHVSTYLEDLVSDVTNFQPGDLKYIDVEGFNHTQSRPMPTVNWPTLTEGAGSGDYLPPGVSALAFFRTGLSRVIARKFLGPVLESLNTNGFFTSAVLTSLSSFIGKMLSPDISLIDAGTLTPGVISKAGTFHALTDGTGSSSPAYQRRRRAGRGI